MYLKTIRWVVLVVAMMLSGRAMECFAAGRPNIVFIMVDDMGYADLGCYGSKVIATPHIDRMASEGMRFTQAYSGCTVCAPARSTLMTGTHMGHTSVRGNTGGIALLDTDVTIAEVLKRAGYATGGFGKWGLGDIDTQGAAEKQGFDLFYGYYHQIHAHSYWPRYLIRNGRKQILPGNNGHDGIIYAHELIFRETLRFIEKNKDRPFFCYAPWTPPHGNYQIPPDLPEWQFYRDKPWPKRDKVIAAMESWIDRQVGLLLEHLHRLGLSEKTVVFFCSDNGASFRMEGTLNSSGPLKGRKRSLYEGGIRVPMIAYWPGHIPAGSVSDLPCYFPDMMPTFAELAGAVSDVPRDVDGLSIVPTLLGEKVAGHRQKRHDYLYWEWPQYNWGRRQYDSHGLMQAIRVGNWKLLRHRTDQPWELYDLSKDVGEADDLAADHPVMVTRLAAMIDKAHTQPREQREPEMPKGRYFR